MDYLTEVLVEYYVVKNYTQGYSSGEVGVQE